jgi:putative spermidine/putrescine transport system permease protein
MIVPIIIIAVGMSFFFAKACVAPDSAMGAIFGVFLSDKGCLANSHLGVIVAHAVLGIPFVIITVTATLSGFDQSLIRAAHSLGANPRTTFFRVIMPLILPGIISGALFAFVTSFDEVVAVLFIAGPDQQTIPRQMFNGIREAISPAILAVATILVAISVLLLVIVELLRRRSDRLRGVTGR